MSARSMIAALARGARIAVGAALLTGFALGAAEAVTIQRVTSPGGVEAWLIEDHSNPIISLQLAFRGGSSHDPQGKEGLADMTAALLDEGAGELSSQAFQGRLQDASISLGFNASMDRFTGGLQTLTKHRAEAFDLLRLALTEARFDTEAVERIRSQILSILAREAENPSRIAAQEWWKRAFPDHPYGRRLQGTPDSVAAIQRADLQGYVKRNLARDRLVVGVVGDITPAELGPLLDRTFADLPAKATGPSVADTAPHTTGETIVLRKAIPQSVVIFGQRGLKREDPKFYAGIVMNYILGGGSFNSRLYAEVREKRGLAYSIGTYLNPLDHAGVLMGSVGTRNSLVKQTIDIIRAEWQRLAAGEVTQNEIDDAKTYLTGSFALQFRNSEGIAQLLVVIQMERLGIDYIDRRSGLIGAVSLDDVKRLAKELLEPDALTFVVVGDPEGLPGG